MSNYEYIFNGNLVIRWDLIIKTTSYSEVEDFIRSITSFSMSFEITENRNDFESLVPKKYKKYLLQRYTEIEDFRHNTEQTHTITIEPCLISFLCRTLNLISFNSKRKAYNIAASKLFFNNQTPINCRGGVCFRFTCSPAWDSRIEFDCYNFVYGGSAKVFPSAPGFVYNGSGHLNYKFQRDIMKKMNKYMATMNQEKNNKILGAMFSDKDYNYFMNDFTKKKFVFDGKRSKFVYKHPFHFNTKCLFVRIKNKDNNKFDKKNNDKTCGKDYKEIVNTDRKIKSVYLQYQDVNGKEKKKIYNTVLDNYTANLLSATPLPLVLIILIGEYGCSIYETRKIVSNNSDNDWYVITRPFGVGQNFCPLLTSYYCPVYHWKNCKVEKRRHDVYEETRIIEESKSNFDEEKLIIEFHINHLIESTIEIITMSTMEFKKQREILGQMRYKPDNSYISDYCQIVGDRLVIAPVYVTN